MYIFIGYLLIISIIVVTFRALLLIYISNKIKSDYIIIRDFLEDHGFSIHVVYNIKYNDNIRYSLLPDSHNGVSKFRFLFLIKLAMNQCDKNNAHLILLKLERLCKLAEIRNL